MSKHILKIEGRSGCAIEVLEENSSIIVRKTSSNSLYNNRLVLQKEKQEKFIDHYRLNSPKIFNDGILDNLYHFDMEYIKGEKFSDLFSCLNYDGIVNILDTVKEYLTVNIKNSSYFNPGPDILIKFQEVRNKIKQTLSEPLLKSIDNMFTALPNTEIPKGPCHGDLTLSNMLFTSEKIYLLDFLDSYIESPLLDMVKIKQDTKFGWSVFIDHQLEDYKITRTLQVLNYMDQDLTNWFEQFDWYNIWYKYFETLNLMRILPYLTYSEEIGFVINSLKESVTS